MNKNLNKWIPWIVLAIVVVIALFFVDFDRFFKSNQTVGEQIDTLTADVEINDIDDDAEFEQALDEAGVDEFID